MVLPLAAVIGIGGIAVIAFAYRITRGSSVNNNRESPSVERTPRGDLEQSSVDFLDRFRRLVNLSKEAMKIYFDRTIKPEDLKKCLRNKEGVFRQSRVFTEIELKKMYPKNKDPTSKDFDITIMYKILRNAGLISQPNSGWGKPPKFEDQSYSDHIERVRLQRNWLEHLTDDRMSNREFILRGTELSLAISKLSDDQLKEEVLKDGYLWRTIKTTIASEVKNEQEKSHINAMYKQIVNALQNCIDVLSEKSTPDEVLETIKFVEEKLKNIQKEDIPMITNKIEKKLEEWKQKNPPNLFIHKSSMKLYEKCFMQYKCSITKASV